MVLLKEETYLWVLAGMGKHLLLEVNRDKKVWFLLGVNIGKDLFSLLMTKGLLRVKKLQKDLAEQSTLSRAEVDRVIYGQKELDILL